MKMLLKSTLAAGLLACAVYGYLLWNNNRSLPPPSQAQMAAALERGIQWLHQKQPELLNARVAPSLWQFVQQAGELTGDRRLQELFKAYETRYLASPSALWRPLFYPGAWVPFSNDMLASLSYYRKHFVYAMTCDTQLASVPEIAAQNDPDFCDSRPLRPACVTHQLMGIRLMQRIQCGDQAELTHTVERLQQRIIRQLTWDPRVVDVYIQRVMMLAESGAPASIKPVWLQNVLDVQRPDGGWSEYEPLLESDGFSISFGPRGFTLRRPDANFHATAQGVLLLSILTTVPAN